jgi:hypothetical protein
MEAINTSKAFDKQDKVSINSSILPSNEETFLEIDASTD